MKLSEKPIFEDAVVPEGSYVPVSIPTEDGDRILRVAPDKIGAQGPAGPAGSSGLQGPPGAEGAPGANGTNGVDGNDGAPGAPGAAGAAGPAWSPSHSTLTYGASVTVDFDVDDYRTVTLTGDINFADSANRAAGKSCVVRVLTDGSPRALAFNAGWVFLGTAPTTQAASKTGILTLTCFGADESDIVAAYSVEA